MASYDDYFLQPAVVRVTAAVIGISREGWRAIADEDATADRALDIMRSERFDVLPIVGDGSIEECFLTPSWNDFSSVSRYRIVEDERIPLEMHIRDLIARFAAGPHHSLFLEHDDGIVGLASVANLNSRETGVYLYSLISDYEVLLGELIRRKIHNSQVVDRSLADSLPRKHQEKKRYDQDRANGAGQQRVSPAARPESAFANLLSNWAIVRGSPPA